MNLKESLDRQRALMERHLRSAIPKTEYSMVILYSPSPKLGAATRESAAGSNRRPSTGTVPPLKEGGEKS